MNDLSILQKAWGEWADATFGDHKDPCGCIYHLEEEVVELKKNPNDLMEYVDCLALLLDAARRAGFNGDDIMAMAEKKLEINKRRAWGKPDANGVIKHIGQNVER